MADGIAIDSDGHRTWLKWHRLQRERADIPFTPRRLAEGLALGASMEVDLRRHGEHGFAVLHDDDLDRETTGHGPVGAASVAELRGLTMREKNGDPSEERVLLLDDLAHLAAADGADGAVIQLDLKEDDAVLDAETAAAFKALIAPVAHRFILSGGDWLAVTRLGADVSGLAIGFDPCDDKTISRLRNVNDVHAFVESALARAPEASMIYLDYRIVLHCDAMGLDIIEDFHKAGKRIDAYTLNADHPRAEATLRRLVALRADQITTDEPGVLQALFESNSTSQG
ncbi:glycerophosphodiester phosphodiesterase [Kaistia dalseonensis]|uniref:Glycerophosphoryl diester phosphodiesterase n=1 Tax=Kaistia dalseonensis TaxID=410840 RepID=A0ABU0HAL2_9HYPH|nr:glycerophosphodiester phosphodiesterase family protein [Kaistia dalseonensis]MCX5496729.1 glycerophosphodiester phosphodiesterase [Kaistia dalseonensis]MDQ0439355.1 glycerophosphoryl diester phosphodiesterase [Kaistia dalseonensis]